MKRLSRMNNLRVGIVLSATGIIAIIVAVVRGNHHLSVPAAIAIGAALLVAGAPFLARALQRTSG